MAADMYVPLLLAIRSVDSGSRSVAAPGCDGEMRPEGESVEITVQSINLFRQTQVLGPPLRVALKLVIYPHSHTQSRMQFPKDATDDERELLESIEGFLYDCEDDGDDATIDLLVPLIAEVPPACRLF